MEYAEWYARLTEEERAAYLALLRQGKVVECHLRAKPTLQNGRALFVLPDDVDLCKAAKVPWWKRLRSILSRKKGG